MSREEISKLLINAERLGFIDPSAVADLEEQLSPLVAAGLLVQSRSEGILVGGKYVRIMPEISEVTRQKLVEDGHIVFASIEPLSLAEIAKDVKYKQYLGIINDSPTILAAVPPRTQIAFDPNKLFIAGSNDANPTEQSEKIAAENKALQNDLGRNDVAISWWPGMASAMVQMEYQYRESTGKSLIASPQGLPFYLRTIDTTRKAGVIDVGRGAPQYQLVVDDWQGSTSSHYVYAPRFIIPIGALVG